jgi:hypothetical protein
MRKILKFPLTVGVGFAILFGGMILLINLFNLEPTDLKATEFKEQLLPYRLFAYLLILTFWKPISRFMARPRIHPEDRTAETDEKWKRLTILLEKSRWKVAAFFLLFEFIVIQNMGGSL